MDTLIRSSVTCHETRIKVWLGWGAVLPGPQHVPVWALLFQWFIKRFVASSGSCRSLTVLILPSRAYLSAPDPGTASSAGLHSLIATGEFLALTFTLARLQGHQQNRACGSIHRLLRTTRGRRSGSEHGLVASIAHLAGVVRFGQQFFRLILDCRPSALRHTLQ